LRQLAVVPPLRDPGDVVQRLAMADEDQALDHGRASSESAVISAGFSSPRMVRIVGATFESTPPLRSLPKHFSRSTRISGTGNVVCAVCGWPVRRSNISSALP